MRDDIHELMNRVIRGNGITRDEARRITGIPDSEIHFLLGCASEIKTHCGKNAVSLCAIVNARSGNCSEDCAFCSQSAHGSAAINAYPLLSAEEIFRSALQAQIMRPSCFGIVTSGNSLTGPEVDTIGRAVTQIKSRFPAMRVGVSIGALDEAAVRKLASAGVDIFHHNLETSRDHFSAICTTHTYDDRVRTIHAIKNEGMPVCGGVIFGVGETADQRVDLAFALRELGIQSIPVNFLTPVPGTRLEGAAPVPPLELLKAVALLRFVNPNADIRICGGRESALRSAQALMFPAGANGMMVGNYLTTPGSSYESDMQMLRDLGLTVGDAIAWNAR